MRLAGILVLICSIWTTPTQAQQGEQSEPSSGNPVSNKDSIQNKLHSHISNIISRSLVKQVTFEDSVAIYGNIVININVNREGNVVDARTTEKGTTISDSRLRKLSEEAAMKWKFSAKSDAPEIQSGAITFKFRPK